MERKHPTTSTGHLRVKLINLRLLHMDMFDLSKIEVYRNDIKNNIKLPRELDEKLAHFLGIHLGDGHLYRKAGDYRMFYDGHYINEFKWYHTFLSTSIYELFNRKIYPAKGHNTIRIEFSSKAIHSFLNKICGLPIGPKTNCDIPQIIKEADMNIKKAFLRGLADTDFSLVFKNRHKNINYYPVIDHQTSNKTLHNSIVQLLSDLGFSVHSGERLMKRKDKFHMSYYLQINGVKALERWMKEIGFTSNNQLTKLQVWRKFGFLPAGTNINDRIDMLNGKKNINSFRK